MVRRCSAEEPAGFFVKREALPHQHGQSRFEGEQPACESVDTHLLHCISCGGQVINLLLQRPHSFRDFINGQSCAVDLILNVPRAEIGINMPGIVQTHAEFEEQVLADDLVHDSPATARIAAHAAGQGKNNEQKDDF